MFTKYANWKKQTGIKIICKLLLVPAKMEKTDYSLSFSLTTTSNSEKKKIKHLRTLKSTHSRQIRNYCKNLNKDP